MKSSKLTWIDCSSIIVSVMLGTGIFSLFPMLTATRGETTPIILLSWFCGMLMAWFGALCFAELSTLFPLNGGEYVFLQKGFSNKEKKSSLPFLFAWSQILVVRPASLVSLAIVLSLNLHIFLVEFFKLFSSEHSFYTIASQSLKILAHHETPFTFSVVLACLILFTWTNILGLQTSRKIQNVLSILKVCSLLALILCGFYFLDAPATLISKPLNSSTRNILSSIAMSLIPIMWVFGGWNEAPYVAGEMKNPNKNIPLALSFGIMSLGTLYILCNYIYLAHLGPEKLGSTMHPANELMGIWFPKGGKLFMASTVVLSCAGAINALALTGGNFSYYFCDNITQRLKKYSQPSTKQTSSLFLKGLTYLSNKPNKNSAPTKALLANVTISLTLAAIVACDENSINKLLGYTSGVVWLFFFLTISTVAIFRHSKNSLAQGRSHFKLPLYPFTLILFMIMTLFMIWGSLKYDAVSTTAGLVVVALGVPIYHLIRKGLPISNSEK